MLDTCLVRTVSVLSRVTKLSGKHTAKNSSTGGEAMLSKLNRHQNIAEDESGGEVLGL